MYNSRHQSIDISSNTAPRPAPQGVPFHHLKRELGNRGGNALQHETVSTFPRMVSYDCGCGAPTEEIHSSSVAGHPGATALKLGIPSRGVPTVSPQSSLGRFLGFFAVRALRALRSSALTVSNRAVAGLTEYALSLLLVKCTVRMKPPVRPRG